MPQDNKFQIIFAPGCFDGFSGTQEELDEMISHLQELAESGELIANAIPLTEDTFDELPDELKQSLLEHMAAIAEAEEAGADPTELTLPKRRLN